MNELTRDTSSPAIGDDNLSDLLEPLINNYPNMYNFNHDSNFDNLELLDEIIHEDHAMAFQDTRLSSNQELDSTHCAPSTSSVKTQDRQNVGVSQDEAIYSSTPYSLETSTPTQDKSKEAPLSIDMNSIVCKANDKTRHNKPRVAEKRPKAIYRSTPIQRDDTSIKTIRKKELLDKDSTVSQKTKETGGQDRRTPTSRPKMEKMLLGKLWCERKKSERSALVSRKKQAAGIKESSVKVSSIP